MHRNDAPRSDPEPPAERTTADVLSATAHALRTVRDYLDRLTIIDTPKGQRAHTALRNAMVLLCRATEAVLFTPDDAQARAIHAQAIADVLYFAEGALGFLEAAGA